MIVQEYERIIDVQKRWEAGEWHVSYVVLVNEPTDTFLVARDSTIQKVSRRELRPQERSLYRGRSEERAEIFRSNMQQKMEAQPHA